MTATRRHRPAYVLWIGPGRLPVNVGGDNYWQPLRYDRQMPHRQPEARRGRAA